MATTAEVRAWAREQGLKVGERGRIHPAITSAYMDAHPDEPPQGYTKKDMDAAREVMQDVIDNPKKLDEETVTARRRKKSRPYVCGFCIVPSNVQHEHCPGTIRNGSQAPQPIIECACFKADHQIHLVIAE